MSLLQNSWGGGGVNYVHVYKFEQWGGVRGDIVLH